MEQTNNVKAVVYTSNAGHTKSYAERFAAMTGLPAFELSDAILALKDGTPVIYMGWLMAGQVKGYKKAMKHFSVRALCGIGMAKSGTQLTDIRKSNPVPEELPVFTLQGGLEIDKLHGIYRLMMQTMKNTAGKGLANKKDRTAEEDEMLQLIQTGGNLVREENLADLMAWYKGDRL